MKTILLLAVFAMMGAVLTFPSSSLALDEALINGSINPGSDPADKAGKNPGSSEAGVNKVGCVNCEKYGWQGRFHKNSNPAAGSGSTDSEKATGQKTDAQ